MKKSVFSRIKIKKHGGGILRQPMGKGHNRSRKNSALLRRKKKLLSLTGVNVKLLKQYLVSR